MFNLNVVSPKAGVGDFFEYWHQPTPYRWQIMGVAVALTFTMMVLFIPKSERAPPAKPVITYISSWPENRSDAEIIASNIANQKRKDAEKALEQKRIELRKEFYRELGKATFVDTDALERQYAADDAAKAATKAKARAEAEAAAKPAATASGQPKGD